MAAAQTHIPPSVDRIAAAILFALLCVATLGIWAEVAWPLSLIEAAISVTFVGVLLFRGSCGVSKNAAVPLVGLAVVTVWGFLQYATGSTAYAHATLAATLQWFAILLTFTMCAAIFANPVLRSGFLTAWVLFGVVLGIWELAGAARPSGNLLWFVPTNHARLYASFPYYNNFAQFQELIIPIAVSRAIMLRGRVYVFASGVLYASVIASGSRAGAILATLEVLVVFTALATKSAKNRKACLTQLAAIALVAGSLTIVAWGDLSKRFEQDHPLAQRALLNKSTLAMIRERPLVGFGLGTYSTVYPSFALFDVGRYVNHAHNDWAEWATEGGLPFAGLILAVVLTSLGPALRSPGGVGLIAIGIHAIIDYPFQRFGVEAWIVALLAAVLTDSRAQSPRSIFRVHHTEFAIYSIGESK